MPSGHMEQPGAAGFQGVVHAVQELYGRSCTTELGISFFVAMHLLRVSIYTWAPKELQSSRKWTIARIQPPRGSLSLCRFCLSRVLNLPCDMSLVAPSTRSYSGAGGGAGGRRWSESSNHSSVTTSRRISAVGTIFESPHITVGMQARSQTKPSEQSCHQSGLRANQRVAF